jgi:hypothetical protein
MAKIVEAIIREQGAVMTSGAVSTAVEEKSSSFRTHL